MAEIRKVYRETIPAFRLIGKKFGNEDRDKYGGFGTLWFHWMKDRRFEEIMSVLPEGTPRGNELAYMPIQEQFSYWIGMSFPPGSPVADGYEYVDVEEATMGTCWIYGKETTGELYGPDMHARCERALIEEGWVLDPEGFFYETNDAARFYTEDEEGKIILDYCIKIKE